MKRKKSRIVYKKERAVLSDVLPYELPLIFSNRHFYRFLVKNRVECRDGMISWKKGDSALDSVIRLLLGVESDVPIVSEQVQIAGETVAINRFQPHAKFFVSIPFCFRIRHKEDDFRELSVCHPRNQVQLVEFYEKYKELILYYCGISPFSIRRPCRVARLTFHKDKGHYRGLSDESVGVEEYGSEYENLRSFFVYKKYGIIFKFYDSPQFHRCEQKYNKLAKLDISKFFDSIYTHSLVWALLGKGTVKENLDASKKTFGGRFDRFMQETNYNETNGIIIGPEFSRIFAELILQSVDKALLNELRDKGYHHKIDYEVLRYVDDYFVFYNAEGTKAAILHSLGAKLREYKLSLNSRKADEYERPIITDISRAKLRIVELLAGELSYKSESVESGAAGKPQGKRRNSIRVDSNSLIVQFKTILRECGVEYKDTLVLALSIIEKQVSKIIKTYQFMDKREGDQRKLAMAIRQICNFVFFIYSVSPRVNSTMWLCRVLLLVTSFFKQEGVHSELRHSVFKTIFDNASLILKKTSNTEYFPIETLYLLIPLVELGKEYWLDSETLASSFGVPVRRPGRPHRNDTHLSYVSIVVLLYYMRDKKKYDRLRTAIEKVLIEKFRSKNTVLRKDTELVLLLLDALACPYVKRTTKSELLSIYGIDGPAEQEAVIRKQKFWFTKWSAFDFARELDAKRSHEVY
jgi:reverse transcriptase-like protein